MTRAFVYSSEVEMLLSHSCSNVTASKFAPLPTLLGDCAEHAPSQGQRSVQINTRPGSPVSRPVPAIWKMECLVVLVFGLGESFYVRRQPLLCDIDLQAVRELKHAVGMLFLCKFAHANE